jgi:GTPase SAR1 family protein
MKPSTVYNFKFLVLGDANSGKSTAIENYVVGNTPLETLYDPTCIVEVRFKKILFNSNDTLVKLQLHDLSGSPEYKQEIKTYMKNPTVVFIFFSLDDRSSFEHVKEWCQESRRHFRGNFVHFAIVGNKLDLALREVDRTEGVRLAYSLNAKYHEISSFSRDDSHVLFEAYANEILLQVEDEKLDFDLEERGITIMKCLSPITERQKGNRLRCIIN